MGTIGITWTANADVAVREAEKVKRKTERMEAEYRRLTGTSAKAADVMARVSRATIKGADDAAKAIANEENAQAQLAAKIAQAKAQKQTQAEQAQAAARKAVEATRKQQREEEKLARAARKVYEDTRTPQERYARKMRELNDLVKRGKINHDTYRRAARQAHQEMTSQASAAKSSMAKWIGKVAGVAAGYVSIQTAIRATTALIKDQEQLHERSRQKTETIAEAQIGALRNLGPVSEEARTAFIKRMEDLATEVSPEGGLKTVYQAASAGLSASGGDVEATERAIRTAGKIAPESAQELMAISEALLHLGKATKTSNAKENLGFLLGLGQQAAVTSMEKISRNLTPGVIGVTGYGGTAQEAGGIVASLTQGMADPEGRKAATAAINLSKQLDTYFTEQGLVTEQTDAPLEQIRYLQEHAAARAEFIEGASFEAKAQIPVEQMLGVAERGDVTRQYLESALPKMVSGQAAAAIADSMIVGLRQPLEQKIAEGTRKRNEGRTDLAAGTVGGKTAAVKRAFDWPELTEDLQAAGVGIGRRFFAGVEYRARQLMGETGEQVYGRVTGDVAAEMTTGRAEGDFARAQSLAIKMVPLLAGAKGAFQVAAQELASRVLGVEQERTLKAQFDPERGEKLRKQATNAIERGREQREQIQREARAAVDVNDFSQTKPIEEPRLTIPQKPQAAVTEAPAVIRRTPQEAPPSIQFPGMDRAPAPTRPIEFRGMERATGQLAESARQMSDAAKEHSDAAKEHRAAAQEYRDAAHAQATGVVDAPPRPLNQVELGRRRP